MVDRSTIHLVVAVLVIMVVMFGCAVSQPAPTLMPTLTPTPTPTLSPTPTPTIVPTPTPAPVSYVLTGAITLFADAYLSHFPVQGSTCYGKGDYSDVTEGLGIVVRNSQGTIMARGSLEAGEVTDIAFKECQFTFAVSSIPFSEFYELAVGSRVQQVYSHADLEKLDWHVDLPLER